MKAANTEPRDAMVTIATFVIDLAPAPAQRTSGVWQIPIPTITIANTVAIIAAEMLIADAATELPVDKNSVQATTATNALLLPIATVKQTTQMPISITIIANTVVTQAAI